MKAFFSLMFAAIALAQQPDYFPLQTGNQWIYRVTGFGRTSTMVLEVTGQRTAGDHDYFVLSGFPSGPMLVRLTDEGRLAIFDSGSNREATWVDFGAAPGMPFTSGLEPCSRQATLISRGERLDTPLGSFDNAVAFRYTGPCADAGIAKDVFLPWIGLTERTETTIGGPRIYSLIYVALGGVTFAAEPHVSFSLSVAQRTARITLRNTRSNPLALTFPTGQDFDLVLKDQAGAEIYRWSLGMAFTQIVREVRISGEKNWVVTIPASVPDGRYIAEAVLSTSPPGQFRATIPVELTSK